MLPLHTSQMMEIKFTKCDFQILQQRKDSNNSNFTIAQNDFHILSKNKNINYNALFQISQCYSLAFNY